MKVQNFMRLSKTASEYSRKPNLVRSICHNKRQQLLPNFYCLQKGHCLFRSSGLSNHRPAAAQISRQKNEQQGQVIDCQKLGKHSLKKKVQVASLLEKSKLRQLNKFSTPQFCEQSQKEKVTVSQMAISQPRSRIRHSNSIYSIIELQKKSTFRKLKAPRRSQESELYQKSKKQKISLIKRSLGIKNTVSIAQSQQSQPQDIIDSQQSKPINQLDIFQPQNKMPQQTQQAANKGLSAQVQQAEQYESVTLFAQCAPAFRVANKTGHLQNVRVALNFILLRKPLFIKSLLKDQTSSVRRFKPIELQLQVGDQARVVLLDRNFIAKHIDQPVYNYSINRQLWPLLIEKALVQVYGGRQQLEQVTSGEVIRSLTSQPHVFLQTGTLSLEQIRGHLSKWRDRDVVLQCKSKSKLTVLNIVKFKVREEHSGAIKNVYKTKTQVQSTSFMLELATIAKGVAKQYYFLKLVGEDGTLYEVQLEDFHLSFAAIEMNCLVQYTSVVRQSLSFRPGQIVVFEFNAKDQTEVLLNLKYMNKRKINTKLALYFQKSINIPQEYSCMQHIKSVKEANCSQIFMIERLKSGTHSLFVISQPLASQLQKNMIQVSIQLFSSRKITFTTAAYQKSKFGIRYKNRHFFLANPNQNDEIDKTVENLESMEVKRKKSEYIRFVTSQHIASKKSMLNRLPVAVNFLEDLQN